MKTICSIIYNPEHNHKVQVIPYEPLYYGVLDRPEWLKESLSKLEEARKLLAANSEYFMETLDE